jgi:N6-L-threonylcarbamoyladenine synthase
LGTTIDDALGEAFDKAAKLLGLGFPGGPAVEKAAAQGDAARFALPRPMLGRTEPHFSFAGLKTALRHHAAAQAPLRSQDIADLCAAFETAVTEAVIDRVLRAVQSLRQRGEISALRCLVVAGGVAANVRLKAGLTAMALAENLRLVVPPPALCTDNGAMIAWAGTQRLALGLTDTLDVAARARWPLDGGAVPAIGSGRAGAKA